MPIQIKTVVIVEDSHTSRERLRARLSATQGVVLIGEYQNMEQATAGMALVAPDAAVIDVKAGDTYSMELVRFLKNRHPQTTVIIYSSEAGAALRSSYAEAGADMFFDKANETEQMLAALSQLSTH
jgi:two-component system capsular synthesis response regulator RcsB